MSRTDASSPSTDVSAEPPRAITPGRIILVLLTIALIGWTIARVRTAQREQARLLTEREQAASVAKTERRDKPLTIRTGVPGTWVPVVEIEGTLQSAEEADLAFRASGRLSAIRVRVGAYVKKGQVIAQLEQTEPTAQLEQARAQLRAAEAQLALAADSEQRTSALNASGAGSPQSALQAKQQHALAAAQTDAARAAVALAQSNLSNTALIAPFSGYVTKVPTGTGQVVSPGAALFHLQNTGELRLVGTISEADAGLVQVGQAIRVSAPDGPITGRISAVLSSVDPSTRRVPIEARVSNDPKHPLLAGSYARATIEGKEPLPALRYPAGVIRPGSQNEAMVLDGTRLRARRVVFHSAPEGTIWVRAGLEAGDRVLVDPSAEAKDGDLVPAGAQVTPPMPLIDAGGSVAKKTAP